MSLQKTSNNLFIYRATQAEDKAWALIFLGGLEPRVRMGSGTSWYTNLPITSSGHRRGAPRKELCDEEAKLQEPEVPDEEAEPLVPSKGLPSRPRIRGGGQQLWTTARRSRLGLRAAGLQGLAQGFGAGSRSPPPSCVAWRRGGASSPSGSWRRRGRGRGGSVPGGRPKSGVARHQL